MHRDRRAPRDRARPAKQRASGGGASACRFSPEGTSIIGRDDGCATPWTYQPGSILPAGAAPRKRRGTSAVRGRPWNWALARRGGRDPGGASPRSPGRRRRRSGGVAASPSMTRIIWATCALVGAARARDRALHARRGVLERRRGRRAHTTRRPTPRACPSFAAAEASFAKKSDSMLASSGRVLSRRPRRARLSIATRRSPSGRLARRRDDAVRDVREARADPADDAPAEVPRARDRGRGR